MDTYRIECQECEEVSHITSTPEPEFCPLCGRRPGVVDLSKDLDAFNDDYD